MYLVDTDVISAAAPTKAAAPAELISWMDRMSPHLFISAVTVAEIEEGIARCRREGATRKARALTAWLAAVLGLYGDRVLAFDAAAASLAGKMADRARGLGHNPGFADAAIAGTAAAHRLTVLTRNLRHFRPLGVAARDPIALVREAGT